MRDFSTESFDSRIMSISFESLALGEPIQRALRERHYTTPSPVQAQTIPHVLEGRDVMGCAQTGTGKTAAFALPILERLSQANRRPRPGAPLVLVIAPTRELAIQIQESFEHYGSHLKLRSQVIFGGVGQNPQVRGLRQGPDILVATPGRLLDLIGQGFLRLDDLEYFVVDEADRMLDMGFIHEVRKIIKLLPAKRQSLFFSATMPVSIVELADTILRDPVKVEVTPPATTVEKIDQRLCHVDSGDKRSLLTYLLHEHQATDEEGLALVFTGMKHQANRIAEHLTRADIPAAAIHGNKSQGARVRALESFRTGKTRVLVATDIAARGIDVKGIDLVINFDLPSEPDSYVHRIGRTARAGAEGCAISLCDEKSQDLLRQIEKNIRMEIPVDRSHPFHRDPQPGDREGRPDHLGGRRGQRQGGRNRRNRSSRGARPGRAGGGGGGRSEGASSGSEAPSKKRRRFGRRGPRGRRSAS